MNQPDQDSPSTVGTLLLAVLANVVALIIGLYLVALWTGTVTGPPNPEFWKQVFPVALLVVFVGLLSVRRTRRFLTAPLRRLGRWVRSLEISTQKQRDEVALKVAAARLPRPSARISGVAGETKHGRMRGSLSYRTKVHTIRWASNGQEVGSLVPGDTGGWDVHYLKTAESLGWVDSKEEGMQRLEAKDLADG